MKRCMTVLLLMSLADVACAQSPSDYQALKAAGLVSLERRTNTVADPLTGAARAEKDNDIVIVSASRFDPNTGQKAQPQSNAHSISGLERDIAAREAELTAMRALLADLKAAK